MNLAHRIPTAAEVAKKFSLLMVEYIGESNRSDVAERNLAETDKSICHSHDKCDANQFMIWALESFGVEFSTEEGSEFDRLSDVAWAIAKRAGFVPMEILVPDATRAKPLNALPNLTGGEVLMLLSGLESIRAGIGDGQTILLASVDSLVAKIKGQTVAI